MQRIVVESVGVLASIVVIIGFIYKAEKKIRLLNAIGCIIFVSYGVLIHSLSIIILNFVCLIVQLINLYRIKKEEDEVIR